MAETLFKIAAQNYGATVWDTEDLSTIRGSSLTLLQMPAHVLPLFKREGWQITVIKAAASELVVSASVAANSELTTPAEAITALEKPNGKLIKKDRVTEAITAIEEDLRRLSDVDDAAISELAGRVVADLGVAIEETSRISSFIMFEFGEGLGTSAIEPTTADAFCAKVLDALSKPDEGGEWPYHLFHFAATHIGATRDLEQDMGRLDTQLRVQQMQQLDCAVPLSGAAPCGMSHSLPAGANTEKDLRVSDSVHERRKVGHRAKQDFYCEEFLRAKECAQRADIPALGAGLAALEGLDGFARDFSEIVEDAPPNASKSVATNMAVVHMDGNSFGRLTKGKAAPEFAAFAEWLEQRKSVMLAQIVSDMKNQGFVYNGVLQFETLMWGGDEFSFVMPSWAVFPFLEVLRSQIDDWTYAGQKLSFAIGVAIAKSKTPIQALKEAAGKLVDIAKDTDRTKSIVQINIYEGVDTLALAPDAFRQMLFDGAADKHDLAIDLADLPALRTNFSTLSTEYGRAGLYALCAGGPPGIEAIERHSARVGSGANLVALLGRSPSKAGTALMNILTLWDYLIVLQEGPSC